MRQGLVVFSMSLAAVGVARAADDTPAVKEHVEVTATKVPEDPAEVPQSITVVSGQDLRDRGATDLRSALFLVSGVDIAPGSDSGPAGSVPALWGLKEFDAFLLVLDGVPYGGAFNPAIPTLPMSEIERIEVVRGPAPVMYGATSFVGVIQVVRTSPDASHPEVAAWGGSHSSGGVQAVQPLPQMFGLKSTVSADVATQGFRDDRTQYDKAHVAWRGIGDVWNGKLTLGVDGTWLGQDPASPHPREGASLSAAVPLDANHNPAGAFLNETRFVASGGWQRPIRAGSLWGTTLSFTHSSQSMFRGFLTDISNTANNASGFKENIDINHVYADTHILWSSRSRLRFMTGADLLFANGEAKGATFTYTVPLSGSTATGVAEPTTLDKDAEDRRIFA